MNKHGKPRWILSVFWLWAASLAYRGLPRGAGFAPGLRNIVAWQRNRIIHWLIDRDRLRWWRLRLAHRLRWPLVG